MTTSIKYRILALTIVVVFGVFNVGIPVVLAACPMMTQGAMCAGCVDDSGRGKVQITGQIDRSCCRTVIAADRNTIEFLQVGKILQAENVTASASWASHASALIVASKLSQVFLHSESPPLSGDIPILISSLLI